MLGFGGLFLDLDSLFLPGLVFSTFKLKGPGDNCLCLPGNDFSSSTEQIKIYFRPSQNGGNFTFPIQFIFKEKCSDFKTFSLDLICTDVLPNFIHNLH